MIPQSCPAPAVPAPAPGRSVRGVGQLPESLSQFPEGVDWAARFLHAVRGEGRVSASTIEAYSLDLGMLSRWAREQDRDLLTLTTEDLNRYVALRAAQGIQLSTLARHMSSFRRLYGFLVAWGVVHANPAAPVLVPPALPAETAPLTDEVLRALLQPSRRRPASPAAAFRAQRDHMLVLMLYATSLGVSDIRLLRWGQLDPHWQVVRVPVRNGAPRTYVLDPKLLAGFKALRSTMAMPGVDLGDSDYCFPTAAGLPMTRQSFCHLVRQWASSCGQAEVVTPSALRRSGRARQADRR